MSNGEHGNGNQTVQRQYRTSEPLESQVDLHERFSTNSLGWHPWVMGRIARHLSGQVLEVGCGTGALWSKTDQALPELRRLVLADYSTAMVTAARGNAPEVASGPMCVVGDAQRLPFPNGAFDVESGEVECLTDADLETSRVPPGLYHSVSVGSSHACALRRSGEVACWGYNFFGQTDAPEGRFRSVDAGRHQACGVHESGDLVCWGAEPHIAVRAPPAYASPTISFSREGTSR